MRSTFLIFCCVGTVVSEFLIIQQLGEHCDGVQNVTAGHLKLHQNILTQLITTEVQFKGRTWNFANLCVRPAFHSVIVDIRRKFQSFVNKFPLCEYSSPLECFNEGGAVRGPHPPIYLSVLVRWILETQIKYPHWQNIIPYDFLKSVEHIVVRFLSPETISKVLEYLVELGWSSGVGYTKKPCFDPNNTYCTTKITDFKSAVQNCSGEMPLKIARTPFYGQKSDGFYDLLLARMPVISPETMMIRMKSVHENPKNETFTTDEFRVLERLWFDKLQQVIMQFNSTSIIGVPFDTKGDVLAYARSHFDCNRQNPAEQSSLTENVLSYVGSFIGLLVGGYVPDA